MKQLVISAKRMTAPIRESWIISFRLNTMLNHRFKNIRPLQLQLALKIKSIRMSMNYKSMSFHRSRKDGHQNDETKCRNKIHRNHKVSIVLQSNH
jgi:hypothetical protein